MIGAAAFYIFKLRRSVSMQNLRAVFPEASENELKKIGGRSYANLGRSFTEFLLLGRIDANYIDRHIKVEGQDNAKRTYQEGASFIAVTGHFGSWEVSAALMNRLGYKMDVVASVQKNRKADSFFTSLRVDNGVGVIPVGRAGRGILRSLKNKHVVALVGDQDARGEKGVVVDFFGRATSVHQGAALFSIRAKVPIICIFIVRKGASLDHLVTIESPLEFQPSGDLEQDIETLTQMHARRLEKWVQKYPDHWFWGHKRWKSMGLYDS